MSDLKDKMAKVYSSMSTTDDVSAFVDEHFAIDFVEHDTIPGIDATGRDVAKMMFGMMKSGMPDVRAEVDMMVEEGNKVVAIGAFVSTVTGKIHAAEKEISVVWKDKGNRCACRSPT